MYFFPYKILGVFQMCLVQKGSKAKSIKLSMKVGCGTEYYWQETRTRKVRKESCKTWHFREVFLYSTLHHFVCRNLNCSLRKFLIPLNLLLCMYLIYLYITLVTALVFFPLNWTSVAISAVKQIRQFPCSRLKTK